MSFLEGSRLHYNKTIIQGSNRNKNTLKNKKKLGGTTLSLTAKERNLKFLCDTSFSFLTKFRSLILLSLKFGKGG
jgi:hypothetical protein